MEYAHDFRTIWFANYAQIELRDARPNGWRGKEELAVCFGEALRMLPLLVATWRETLRRVL